MTAPLLREPTSPIKEPLHLKTLLASFPKHLSPLAEPLSEVLRLEGFDMVHPEMLNDLAGLCVHLSDYDEPVWYTGTKGYVTRTCGRSPKFAEGIQELRRQGLVHFHRLSTGGTLLTATSKLRYKMELLGADG